MIVAYDGSGFHGFAAQPGLQTVAGSLCDAIGKVTGHRVELVCAGRTDSGVHAWGQVVHVDLDPAVEPDALAKSVNSMVGPRIVVRQISVAPDGFDARHSALARRYGYLILNSPVASPFLAATSWHVGDALDMHALMLAADPLIGEHDFSSFCRRAPDKKPGDPMVRKVLGVKWSEVDPWPPMQGSGSHGAGTTSGASAAGAAGAGGVAGAAGACDVAGGIRLLRFEIISTSFCHQMVRSLVGTMVEMGRGRRTAGEMAAIIRSKDRAFAAPPAPPHGLCLEEVIYPN